MTEKFTICLVHDKDQIQDIIDNEEISIKLEQREVAQLNDALANGRNELVIVQKSWEQYEKEVLMNQINTLQGMLNQLKQAVNNE